MACRAVTDAAHAPHSAVVLLNGLLTAATAGLIRVLARKFGYATRVGVILALVFALLRQHGSTYILFQRSADHPLPDGRCPGIMRFAQRSQTRWLALLGGALGLAILARINAVVALPAFGLYLVLTWRAKQVPVPLVVRQATIVLTASGLVAGLALLCNVIRFGELFDFGYRTANWQAPFLVGLYGLTLSPGKGLLARCLVGE
jgi:hypothetical protein